MQNFGKILQYCRRYDKKIAQITKIRTKISENLRNLAKFRRKKKNSQKCQRSLAKLSSPFCINPRARLHLQEDP
jgi:phage terminase small subunit